MIAILRTGGKQYTVEANQIVRIEKLIEKAEGDNIVFDDILLIADGDKLNIGTPVVKGATVTATVVKQGRARKVRVVKYKNKTRYKRTLGHRQHYTEVKIEAIKG